MDIVLMYQKTKILRIVVDNRKLEGGAIVKNTMVCDKYNHAPRMK